MLFYLKYHPEDGPNTARNMLVNTLQNIYIIKIKMCLLVTNKFFQQVLVNRIKISKQETGNIVISSELFLYIL